MSQLVLTDLAEVLTVPRQTVTDNPLGVIPDGAVALSNGKIAWVGAKSQLPQAYQSWPQVSYAGCIAMPGLIDSHTHPVFAGDRADEFEMRLQGDSYLSIAQRGGGILKTVSATRQASLETLITLTRERLETSMRFGISTIEAKSGYGLTTESELKSLAVLGALQKDLPMEIIPTFMGAHDIPPEFSGQTDAYVDLVCREMIPAVAEQGIAQYCDVFCETGYFSVAQSRRILETGLAYGLKPRIHAEEFSDLEGAIMACELGALSADHLLHLSDTGIEALAKSHTVATLLPGTAFYLRLKEYAPARKLWDAGATVALATDFNPGSSMSENLLLAMTLACLQMGLLPHEAIQAVTLNAAKALGFTDRGSLVAGYRADIAVYQVNRYEALLYHYGINPLKALYIKGTKVL